MIFCQRYTLEYIRQYNFMDEAAAFVKIWLGDEILDIFLTKEEYAFEIYKLNDLWEHTNWRFSSRPGI